MRPYVQHEGLVHGLERHAQQVAVELAREVELIADLSSQQLLLPDRQNHCELLVELAAEL